MRAASPPRRRTSTSNGDVSSPAEAAIGPVPMRSTQRRMKALRMRVWCATAAEPLALDVSCATPTTAVRNAPAKSAPSAAPTDPEGFATPFLELWPRSDAQADTTTARTVAGAASQTQVGQTAGGGR